MESEFVASEKASVEAEWLRNLLVNIPSSVSIHCDNQVAIAKAKNKTYNGKNRHIHLKHNIVKKLYPNFKSNKKSTQEPPNVLFRAYK